MVLLETWWVWLAAALVLAMLELALPGYILLGFSLGALATAALVVSPFAPGGLVLVTLFAGMSLGAWLLLRELFPAPRGSTESFDRDINDD